MSTYEMHPAALIFPPMNSAAFAGLKADIEANGQKEWIVLFEGKILDGRNRYQACCELGIEPEFCDLEACEDPIAYVISHNLHRRQLSPTQLSYCAAKVATLKNGSNQYKSKGEGSQNCEASRDEAAKIFSVSPRSVDAAREVIDSGSAELNAAVARDEIKVSLAEKLVRAFPAKQEQNKLVKEGVAAIREAINGKPKKAKKTAAASDRTSKDDIAAILSNVDDKLVVARVLFEQCLPGIRKTIHRLWKEWLEDAT